MTDYAIFRRNMVENQIRPNRVTDSAILTVMGELPRERFLPEALRGVAYVDEDIEIAEGRYLMEPLVLARLLQAAAVDREDMVLDIGCATAYSTAVLARLAGTVVAVESDPNLAAGAMATLEELGIDNAVVIEGPLAEGYPAQAPYNVILLGGAVPRIPDKIADQLAEGGRLVAVIGDGSGAGKATLMIRTDGVLSSRTIFDAGVRPLPGFAAPPGFVF